MKDIYYSLNDILSYNALFSFVIGIRGHGKTYSGKDWAIRDFLKTGNQFIYLRRFDTEFDKGKKEKFFDDIMDKFPEHKFKIKGYVAYIDDKVAGQFMALSKSKIEKSTPFPKVNKIIFDEFILDRGNYYYLPDEVTNFLELYNTVDRYKDTTRVVFMSNAITITNPYFLYFSIKLKNNKRFTKVQNDIVVEMDSGKKFAEKAKNTRFGKLIAGTQYSHYAIENSFLRDSETFIEKKTGNSRHWFTMSYKNKKYGVWADLQEGKFFVSEDTDGYCKLNYAITTSDLKPNTMLLKSKNCFMLKKFIANYKLGNVYYESMNIKNIVYEIIRLSLI